MHRLYGVTMPEKGVSQLVAVDLEKAEELVAQFKDDRFKKFQNSPKNCKR